MCPNCESELLPDSVFCHRCGKRIRDTVAGRWRSAALGTLVVGWVACLVALLLIIFVDVESVVGTGPVIFLLGLGTIFVGIRVRHPATWLLGLTHCAICVLFTALVNGLRWGPSDATTPFTIMGLVYVALTLPPTVLAYRNMPAARPPWECAQCGYLRYGRPEPRCPECGTPVDPSRVPATLPGGSETLQSEPRAGA